MSLLSTRSDFENVESKKDFMGIYSKDLPLMCIVCIYCVNCEYWYTLVPEFISPLKHWCCLRIVDFQVFSTFSSTRFWLLFFKDVALRKMLTSLIGSLMISTGSLRICCFNLLFPSHQMCHVREARSLQWIPQKLEFLMNFWIVYVMSPSLMLPPALAVTCSEFSILPG